jgi:formylglycine-generating enzyme required for sulfatase activity
MTRGKDGYIFPWGNEFQTQNANTPLRWQKLKQTSDTTPVGAFELGKGPYGLYDMSGK